MTPTIDSSAERPVTRHRTSCGVSCRCSRPTPRRLRQIQTSTATPIARGQGVLARDQQDLRHIAGHPQVRQAREDHHEEQAQAEEEEKEVDAPRGAAQAVRFTIILTQITRLDQENAQVDQDQRQVHGGREHIVLNPPQGPQSEMHGEEHDAHQQREQHPPLLVVFVDSEHGARKRDFAQHFERLPPEEGGPVVAVQEANRVT
eukprot:1360072-Prymnesium_polylepis.1